MNIVEDKKAAFNRIAEIVREDPDMHPIIALPYFFQYGGKPFSTEKHFYTEVLYKTKNIPHTTTFMTGRQLGKSLGMAAQTHFNCWTQKFFSILVFSPLCSQVTHLSDTYFGPLVNDSPIRDRIVSPSNKQNSLFRAFRNGSTEIFSYATDSPDRMRGKSVDAVAGDEMQDFNWDFLPVIEECMSAREHVGIRRYFGTPKTKDNTLTKLFESGSQAEWTITCTACKKENIPNLEHDILKMIGKTGVVCANSSCGKPLNPATGRWVHKDPTKRVVHASYHIPQIICPHHYAIREKWEKLLFKFENQNRTTFYNEVLGQPIDSGLKLVSQTELQNASTLNVNCKDIEDVRNFIQGRYIYRALGVDWSGGGAEYQSYTGVALVGIRPDGTCEVPYMAKLQYTTDHKDEAEQVRILATQFAANFIAHDFSGAGNVRETLLVMSGWPLEKIMPMTLSRTSGQKGILFHNNPNDTAVRNSYTLDKGRSLVLTCTLIKSLGIKFGRYETCQDHLEHFLALTEHYTERPTGGPVFSVHRAPGKPDDIAHAVNFAVMGLFYAHGWPDITRQFLTRGPTEDEL